MIANPYSSATRNDWRTMFLEDGRPDIVNFPGVMACEPKYRSMSVNTFSGSYDGCQTETSEWQLTVNARFFSQLKRDYESSHENRHDYLKSETARLELDDELKSIQERDARLRVLLRDNPHIKSVWDEAMVMLKLHGFNDTIGE